MRQQGSVYNYCNKKQPDLCLGLCEIGFPVVDGKLQLYVGMTNRKFKTRMKKHIANIKYSKKTATLARLHNIELLQINI